MPASQPVHALMRPIDIIWVCLGGGAGSLLRWGLGGFIDRAIPARFKYGTFLVNVSGAFAIAYLSAALALEWQHRHSDVVSSLVLTGFLGGYTTFSSMQLDAAQMAMENRHGLAALYLVASVGVGLCAAAAGVALARA